MAIPLITIMKNQFRSQSKSAVPKGAQHHTGSRCAWQEAFEETHDLLYSPSPQKAHIQREVDVEYATSSWCSGPRSDCRNHRDISDISDNASTATTSSATASLKSFSASILRDVKFESANSRLYYLQSSATLSIELTVKVERA